MRLLLLILTTIRRLTLLTFVFLAWAPAAYAWSRPVEGPVLQPFAYDEAHPYAAGQHRGIDIGAGAAGETVVAPAAGTVSFAGTVPTNGKSVTIETADGYSVTLTHLGSIGVSKGSTIAEQAAVGTVGPSGTPEVDGPYVHLGIRVTTDPNGYVDPLGLLPPATQAGGTDTGSTATQPNASAGSSAKPAHAPPTTRPRRPTARGSGTDSGRTVVSVREHERAQQSRPEVQPARSAERPVIRAGRRADSRAHQRDASARSSSLRLHVVEPSALDAGHEIGATAPVAPIASVRRPTATVLGPVLCNGVPALLALAAAFVAGRRRRRRCAEADPASRTQVLHLPRTTDVRLHVSRAA